MRAEAQALIDNIKQLLLYKISNKVKFLVLIRKR